VDVPGRQVQLSAANPGALHQRLCGWRRRRGSCCGRGGDAGGSEVESSNRVSWSLSRASGARYGSLGVGQRALSDIRGGFLAASNLAQAALSVEQRRSVLGEIPSAGGLVVGERPCALHQAKCHRLPRKNTPELALRPRLSPCNVHLGASLSSILLHRRHGHDRRRPTPSRHFG